MRCPRPLSCHPEGVLQEEGRPKDLGVGMQSKPMKSDCWVYILSNKLRMLYVGVTNDLERRVSEHRARLASGFPERYGLMSLVYFESTGDVRAAIAREKQIKGWVRRKKVALIHSVNQEWKDLSTEWTPLSPDILHCAQNGHKYTKCVLFGVEVEVPVEVAGSPLCSQPTVLTIASFESGEVAFETVGRDGH